jgi:hypothetical protein
MGLNFGTGHRNILTVIIEDFFFRRVISSGDYSYGNLVLLLQSSRPSFFVHNDSLLFIYFIILVFHPSLLRNLNPEKVWGIIISIGYSKDKDYFDI